MRHPGGIRWRPTVQPVGGPGTWDSAVTEGKSLVRQLGESLVGKDGGQLVGCGLAILRIPWEKSQLVVQGLGICGVGFGASIWAPGSRWERPYGGPITGLCRGGVLQGSPRPRNSQLVVF